MKKPILVLIASIAVLSVIGLVTGNEELVKVLAVGALAGILLALITLIPAIRKRLPSDFAGRVVTILTFMMIATALVFSVLRWLEVKYEYWGGFIPYMGLGPDPDYAASPWGARTFYTKYEHNRRAIERETWVRAMVLPILRWKCYTIDKDTCEFVDLFPKIKGLMSWNSYLLVLAIALGCSLPGGALARHFTRRKHPADVVVEG